MAYEPSVDDALRAYLTAAAYLSELSVNASDHPGIATVNATTWGDFIIADGSDRDIMDSFIAICTYLEADDLWLVQLRPRRHMLPRSYNPVLVRDKGGEFVAVDEE